MCLYSFTLLVNMLLYLFAIYGRLDFTDARPYVARIIIMIYISFATYAYISSNIIKFSVRHKAGFSTHNICDTNVTRAPMVSIFVAMESLYSMDRTMAMLTQICDLAEEANGHF